MSSLERNSDTLLAIVGASGRFPGAADMESFWRLLSERGDAIRPVPKERWDANAQLDPEKTVQSVGGFLDDVDQFDPTFFGVSPREAEDIDPQQRLMLEASWIALEDAGRRPETLAGASVGVYVGASWHDYEILRKERGAHATQHTAVGQALDVIAARVSYFYKLTGPSLAVETGCSSAMVALHLAAQALSSGEIEGAIVGGVNLILAPDVSVGLTRFGGLSPDGRCKAFAAAANGFVRGEGVAAFYLKTLARAQADGDRIHVVVVATAVNNDGGGDSLVTPNPSGQEDLLRRVYARAGAPLDRVVYIETHGTGTAVGDPIEAGAIGRAIGQKRAGARAPLAIGSVKTNIGHLEATAGLAGVAKALLAIRHREVPPNLHADAPNPSIPFDELGLEVLREPLPLPADEPFYIGVNSFGWGGTNAHVILAPPPRSEARKRSEFAETAPILFPISAHHDESLRRRAADVRAVAASDDATLADIAGTLAWRRGHFARRAAFLAESREALCAALDRFAAGEDEIAEGASGMARERGKVAFVFPGQGSQWVGMGARLFVESPIFAATIRRCAQALAPHVDWNLEEVVAGSGDEWTTRVDMVQPALWAMFVALAEMWREAGVEPDVVVGHSQGEVAAATVAGILSLEDAALIVARRAAIIRRKAGKGLMLAVDLDLEAARAALAGFEDNISIAVNNGPTSCVLSGDSESVTTLKELLDADGVFNRLVRVDYASHSHHMDEFKDELRDALKSIRPRVGRAPLFSTVRLNALAGPEMDADYWVQNLREPVLFADAMARLFAEGVTHVVEVSSHTALVPALEQLAALESDPPRILSTMQRDHGAPADIALAFARAYVAGLEPFAALPRDAHVELPAYPWRRASYWLPPAKRRTAPGGGLDVALLPAAAEKDLWEGALEIALDDNPWLRDHKVHDAIVLPGAAMLALALATGRARLGVTPRTLANVRFIADLTLGEEPARVGVAFRDDVNEGGTFALLSLAAGATSWSEHSTARVEQRARPVEARAFPAHLLEQAPRDAEAFYRACAARGLNYGPAFQGVQRIFASETEALGELRLPQSCRAGARAHGLHPALLDAALQVSLALCESEEAVVPTQIRRLTLFVDPQEPATALWAHAIRRDADHYDLAFFADDETPFALLEGLALEALAAGDPASGDAERLHRLRFVAQPRSEAQAAPAGAWIVCGANADGAQQLHDALAIARARVRAATPDSISAADELTGVVYVAPRAASGLDAQKRGLLALTTLARACSERASPPRLVVVTADAQAVVAEDRPDPGAALFWGFTRVLRREQPELQALVLDVASTDARWAEACAAEILAGGDEDQAALRGDTRFVGRLTRGDDERASPLDAYPWQGPAQPFRLAAARPGFWDRLEYRPLRRETPGPGEIEIEVAVASLNFIDVMKAMGTYPGVEGRAALLGGECAGRVVAVGPGVSYLAPGDRVAACAFGSFASHVTTRADHAQKIPDVISNEVAAALPLVMATAWYALVDLADLAEGESVLIHSATGGLGLAAIEVARARGARILATAGSEEKRSRLARLGIADVFDSRDLSWAEGVRAATAGRGVDVVLNSLAGAAIPLGLDALAEDGRFIEVGKKDIYSGRAISLSAFKKGISVSAVDLAGLMERRPERFARLFADVWARIVAGALTPPPVKAYAFADAAEALREMARGAHIGKFVLTRPKSVRHIAPEPTPQGRFRADATYLVTGGLGALGLSLADYLVENGAGAIALLGRSPPNAEAERRIAALASRGALVESFAVDVSDADALGRTLANIRAHMPQLRGVAHGAGLLDDAMIVNLRQDQLDRVLAPKVEGARNLDALTKDDPLDLFVMFSSAAALVGNIGQAAYASANAYMDALAEARRRQGRPALSVQWGPFAGIGLAAQDDIRGARLAQRGMGSFSAAEAWAALARLLQGGASVVGYVPIELRQWFEAYPATAAQPSWALLREAARSGAQTTAADDFRSQLEAAPEEARRELAEGKVRELAGRVLRLDPKAFDRETPFKALGLDSLMGLELRNRLEAAFGLKLSPTLLWTYGNARALTEVLCGSVFSAAV
ncbi:MULTISPECIES: type I polyketide synthase [Methylosinus]|uniref:Type I polyketide synthase n=1 Tax=Methylosinus trichosporium (strain ATCC 35070 / NCIMB 11131 / UNIQEM 75 / OB3b) TaxID=595536 RepID=A0A2D2D7I6_METT3|nr:MULTISPECIES: type I polyketide synthase [Methylosinus]ATQ70967.1 type I polyketide synthase [Methylosinus trichosporium OB3b]OBS54394.1 acyl transferase [Methylosinus sp. 3S-1]